MTALKACMRRGSSPDELAALYGNSGSYVKRAIRRINELERDGWLLPADAQELRARVIVGFLVVAASLLVPATASRAQPLSRRASPGARENSIVRSKK